MIGGGLRVYNLAHVMRPCDNGWFDSIDVSLTRDILPDPQHST